MKKILTYALLFVAPIVTLTACSNDNDLPDVKFDVTFSGGVVDDSNGIIYVVAGDTLTVNSVSVTNVESNKVAAVTGVEYYWDYDFIGSSPFEPYRFKIYVGEETPLGAHNLTLRAGVVAVDKQPAVAVLDYNVEVVADSTDIPQTATNASVSAVVTPQANS